jgi:hypothetical protein
MGVPPWRSPGGGGTSRAKPRGWGHLPGEAQGAQGAATQTGFVRQPLKSSSPRWKVVSSPPRRGEPSLRRVASTWWRYRPKRARTNSAKSGSAEAKTAPEGRPSVGSGAERPSREEPGGPEGGREPRRPEGGGEPGGREERGSGAEPAVGFMRSTPSPGPGTPCPDSPAGRGVSARRSVPPVGLSGRSLRSVSPVGASGRCLRPVAWPVSRSGLPVPAGPPALSRGARRRFVLSWWRGGSARPGGTGEDQVPSPRRKPWRS